MPKIDQRLILKLADKLGIEAKTVYARVQKVVADTHLERHIAALYLARQHNINIDKYSTYEQRSELRGIKIQAGPVPARDVSEHVPTKPLSRKSNSSKVPRKSVDKSVFVIHGRDAELNESIYNFIRSLNLEVIEWNHALKRASKGNANPYIGDILDKVLAQAGALVVLLSPEDMVRLHPDLTPKSEAKTEGKTQLQARPNVLFEAGLALGAHPNKTILVQVGTIKPFSDVGGMHIHRLSNSTSSRHAFINKLEVVLGPVDRTGETWTKTGNFEVKRKKITS